MISYIDSELRSIDVVFYHASCADGMCSAAIVRDFFPNVYAVPVQYGEPEQIDNVLQGVPGTILFVDFCPEKEHLERIRLLGRDWFVIDHHESRQWIREFPENSVYDQNFSGAWLTWKFLYPHLEVPDFIRYIHDRDLYSFNLTASRAIAAAVRGMPQRIDAYIEKIHFFDFEKMKTEGEKILEVEQRIFTRCAERSHLVSLAGERVRLVNCTTLISETCNHILETKTDVDIAVAFFLTDPEIVVLCFRARAGASCIELAEKLGGGGHRCSAGARVTSVLFSHIVERITS